MSTSEQAKNSTGETPSLDENKTVAPSGKSHSYDKVKVVLDRANEYKTKGNSFVSSQSWPQAALAYKTARMQLMEYITKPDDQKKKEQADAGMAGMMRGKPKLSAEEQKAVDDLNKTIHLNLCLVQLRLHKTTDALKSADIALFHEPGNVKALFRRGTAHLEKKDVDAAKADFNEILKIDPENADAKMRLSECEAAVNAARAEEKKLAQKMFS